MTVGKGMQEGLWEKGREGDCVKTDAGKELLEKACTKVTVGKGMQEGDCGRRDAGVGVGGGGECR